MPLLLDCRSIMAAENLILIPESMDTLHYGIR